jgi:hypothetical protein
MTAWTSDDVYGALEDAESSYGDVMPAHGSMAGATLNGTHTVEQTGTHVAALALVAVVVLIILNRLNIHAAVAATS